MVTSRGERSTIPQDKNPLAGVHYSQPRPPIDSLISDTTKEAKAAPETEKKADVKSEENSPSPSQQKGKVTVLVSNDGLKDQFRESLADLGHDVFAAVLPAVVATAQDSRDSNLRVKPLPDHLNVTKNLSQAVKVQHGCLHRNNHFRRSIESIDRHQPHVGRAVKEHVREAVGLELPELEFEDLL